ncbi:MAG: hypothetical protein ACYDBX_04310, partial [Patescibacteria group bacterium]
MYNHIALSSSYINTLSSDFIHFVAIFLLVIILLILVLILISFVLIFITREIKISNFVRKSKKSVSYEVKLPMDNEIEIGAAEQMFSSFSGLRKGSFFDKLLGKFSYITLEIIATSEIISFYVTCNEEIADFVEKQIHASYPVAEVIKKDKPDIFKNDASVEFAQLGFSKKSYFPI